MSATVPPPSVTGTEPKVPMRNRRPISMLMLLLTPHAMEKTTKRRLPPW